MAQTRDPNPEKQLLKIIEEPKEKSASTQIRATKRSKISFFSPGAWKGRISFLMGWARKWPKDKKARRLDIVAVNRLLGFCSFVLLVYLVGDVSLSMRNAEKMSDIKFQLDGDMEMASLPEAEVFKKSASYYLEKARSRNIFKMGEIPMKEGEPEEEEAKPVVALPDKSISEVTQHLKLVGISWSDDPDAMLEDTRAIRTFFVKRGQMIGDIKVQAILRDKVILNYKGKEVELK